MHFHAIPPLNVTKSPLLNVKSHSQPAQSTDTAPLSGTTGPARQSLPTPPTKCGAVDARGHRYRPYTVSALWHQATCTAPSARSVDAPCKPRGFRGGAYLRLIMILRSFPR